MAMLQSRLVAALVCFGALSCGRIGYNSLATEGSVDAFIDEGDAGLGFDTATAMVGPMQEDPDASMSTPPPVDAAGQDAGAEALDAVSPMSDAARTASCLSRYPTALFCDDFEEGLPSGQSVYEAYASNGTVGISTTKVHRGAGSFRGSFEKKARETSVAVIHRNLQPPIESGPLYLRAHFNVPSGFLVSGWHVNMEIGGGDRKISFDMVDEDTIQLAVGPANLYPRSAPNRFQRDRWFCAELAIVVAAPGGQGVAQLYIDGVKVLEVPTGTNTLPLGGFNLLKAGAVSSNGLTASGETFMDDIVLSTTPIGCQ